VGLCCSHLVLGTRGKSIQRSSQCTAGNNTVLGDIWADGLSNKARYYYSSAAEGPVMRLNESEDKTNPSVKLGVYD